MEENKNKDPLYIRICGLAITIGIVVLIEAGLGSIIFMIFSIVFKKVCEYLGATIDLKGSVLGFIFGFVSGNVLFLILMVVNNRGKRPGQKNNDRHDRKGESA